MKWKNIFIRQITFIGSKEKQWEECSRICFTSLSKFGIVQFFRKKILFEQVLYGMISNFFFVTDVFVSDEVNIVVNLFYISE